MEASVYDVDGGAKQVAFKDQLHNAVTATDTAEIDITLTGQDIKADIKTASVVKSKLDSGVQASLEKADSAIQDISGKQDTLVSGTSIKTVNSTSLLGSGNIVTPNTTYTASSFDIKDLTDSTALRSSWTGKQDALAFTPEDVSNKQTDLTASATKYPTVNAVNTGLSGKQDTLVSGTNIKTINSTSLLGSGDIEITGGSGAVDWIAKSGAYTAENGNGILADTSGSAWTLTLPSSPSVGDVVGISDASGSFSTNNLTIANNGSKIMGASENLVIDIDDASFLLVYTGSTDGWKLDTYMPYGSDITKATGAEVNTGTNDDKYVTPKAIADSNYIKDSYLSSNNYQQIKVSSTEPSSPTTGDLWLDIA